jgi:D-glycero-D-manno-heptose 1,7-bisphosphate phosphatase
MDKAVFLDRDGVITQDPPHYAHRTDQLRLIPHSADAIRLLNENGFKVFIVSNQSGIARGYYPEKDTLSFNKELKKELLKKNASIDGIYYCPHHPNAKIKSYRIKCDCRKPEPGMIQKASEEHNIDLSNSFMIGDRTGDIIAGKKAGCKTIHVLTGVGRNELSNEDLKADFTTEDLFKAVKKVILNKTK